MNNQIYQKERQIAVENNEIFQNKVRYMLIADIFTTRDYSCTSPFVSATNEKASLRISLDCENEGWYDRHSSDNVEGKEIRMH